MRSWLSMKPHVSDHLRGKNIRRSKPQKSMGLPMVRGVSTLYIHMTQSIQKEVAAHLWLSTGQSPLLQNNFSS